MINGLSRQMDTSNLTQEEWLGADDRFGKLRHQAADMDALMDECVSEPLDRSDWVLPRYGEQRRYESVSYTHLRAHETVLDLVCRLLLEKKKKQSKQLKKK